MRPKISNAYIVYYLDDSLKFPLHNFTLKNCLFGITNIVKNSDKGKWRYSGYGIAFDEPGSWNFDNDLARNVLIFGVDNNSESHASNCKNNVLVLGEGPTDNTNHSAGFEERKFGINFSKERTTFCMSLHYNHDNSY